MGFLDALTEPRRERAYKALLEAGTRRAEKALTASELQQEYDAVEEIRLRGEGKIERSVRTFFNQLLRTVLTRLDEVKQVTGDELLNQQEAIDIFMENLEEDITTMILLGWGAGARRAGNGSIVDMPLINMQSAMNQMARPQQVIRTTADMLARELAFAIDTLPPGLSRAQLAQRLKPFVIELFREMRENRIPTITETTAVGAFEAGQLQAWLLSGVPYKTWLSQRDGRVRPSHIVADGQVVDVAEPFLVGNALMQHPGDPSGPASEVVNCRCTMLPSVDRRGTMPARVS